MMTTQEAWAFLAGRTESKARPLEAVSARLYISLTEPEVLVAPHTTLKNKKATPSAQITSLELKSKVYVREEGDSRPITEEELGAVAFENAGIEIKSLGHVVKHDAPNGEAFTVRDLLQAVEDTERQVRGVSEWFGGVDCHHIYYEGLHLQEDGTYSVFWGS